MQAFQQLPPDQQQSILQRLGGQGGSSRVHRAGNDGQGTQERAEIRAMTAPTGAQTTNRNNPNGNQQPTGGIPVFGPDDWVLVDINLPGEKSVAQQAADDYARELNADALQALTGQVVPGRSCSAKRCRRPNGNAANAPAPILRTTA